MRAPPRLISNTRTDCLRPVHFDRCRQIDIEARMLAQIGAQRRAHDFRDFGADAFGRLLHVGCDARDLGGVGARSRHHAGDAGHSRCDIRDGRGGAAHIGDQALRRGALLIHRGGNRIGHERELVDRLGNRADRRHRVAGGRLDLGDLGADLTGCLAGLRRERLHLGRDDRKAPSRLAGTRGLDRGVEREQIGLLGNRRDDADDVADVLRGLGERTDGLPRVGGTLHRGAADVGAFLHLHGDRIDRGDHLVGEARRVLVHGARMIRGLRRLGRGAVHRFQRATHIVGLGAQHGRAVDHGAQAALGRGLDLGRHVRQVGAARDAFGLLEADGLAFRALAAGHRAEHFGDSGGETDGFGAGLTIGRRLARAAACKPPNGLGRAANLRRDRQAHQQRQHRRQRRNRDAKQCPDNVIGRSEDVPRQQCERRQKRNDKQPFGDGQALHLPPGAPGRDCSGASARPVNRRRIMDLRG